MAINTENVNVNTEVNELVENVWMVENVCEHCGQVVNVPLVDVVTAEYGVEGWCPECAAHAVACERCGELCEPVEVNDNGTVVKWCEDCANHYAYRCERCGEWSTDEPQEVITDDAWWCSNRTTEWWCEDCATHHTVSCDSCGDLLSEDAATEVDLWNGDSVTVCLNCLDEEYVRCYSCGDWVLRDEAYYDDDRDEWFCPNHIPAIGGYHHTGGCYFWLDDGTQVSSWMADRTKLYLGIELEVDDLCDRNEAAREILSEFSTSKVECKHDGSLSSDGFEIVSQPMTPHYTLTCGMWERICEIVRSYGGRSHESGTCGLHIHLSRSFFKDYDAVYRLDRLFHRFQNQLVRFSRRTYDQMEWCEIRDDSELLETSDIEERKSIWRGKKNCDGYHARYQAVNDRNDFTVEIRLWRGTLNVETLRATIELTTALAIVANTMTDELAESLNWSMLKMLARYALEGAELPHDDLDRYLVRRGL